jgi:hypothetical protein
MTIDEFLKRMLLLYGPPESLDDRAFLEEYRLMLKKVDERILKPASDEIVATHTRRGWPTPAETMAAVKKGSTLVFGAYLPPEHRKFEPPKPMTEEAKAEHEASKARVDAMAKDFINSLRGPPRASRPVDLPWLEPGEFEELMAKVPDRPAPKPSTPGGKREGFVKLGEVPVNITSRMLGERD